MGKRKGSFLFKSASTRTWIKRGGIALMAGLTIGATTGFISLRYLEGEAPKPAVVEQPELPSTEAPARRTIRGPRADGMRAGESGQLIGQGSLASRGSIAVVPDLVGRVEGDARRLLERAGFTMGSVLFRESDESTGTVLETFPVPGERVPLPATVNLILAERRRSIDTTTFEWSAPDSIGTYTPDTVP